MMVPLLGQSSVGLPGRIVNAEDDAVTVICTDFNEISQKEFANQPRIQYNDEKRRLPVLPELPQARVRRSRAETLISFRAGDGQHVATV